MPFESQPPAPAANCLADSPGAIDKDVMDKFPKPDPSRKHLSWVLILVSFEHPLKK